MNSLRRKVRAVVLALALVESGVVGPHTAAAQSPTPDAISAATRDVPWPTARARHHMFWSPRLNAVLLIGQAGASDIISWSGIQWRTLGRSLDERGNHAVAYDMKRDRVVVQGGGMYSAGHMTPLDDTWEWNGRAWRKLNVAGPGMRDHHDMAYDPVRQQIVLFGGFRGLGTALNDTWGWNGRSWKQLADGGPPGRGTHRMAFDAARGVMVLFGGYGVNNALLGDTWEWDGARWRQINTATSPTPRADTRMAYDAARKRVVLFGGKGASGSLGDTWEFDGTNWTRLDVAGPTMRNAHDMVYDPRAQAVLLFAGRNEPTAYNDFWSFNGTWKQIPRPDAHAVGSASVVKGQYPVGYRVIDYWDRSRRMSPARDFEGRTNTAERAVPMQISVWYPAQAAGSAMRIGQYWAQSAKSSTLGAITEADAQATAPRIRSGMLFQLGVDVPQATADSIRDLPTTAVRNTATAAGRFPVVITGSGPLNYGLAEYLASHGYVVVGAPTVGTASQQVNRVPVAIETHTRNMETSTAVAATLPFVDPDRMALLGINFDGLAALSHQLRNMSALAVVSIDGYETKTASAAGLRASPYFDPARLRVPYLSFAQDNPPGPGLMFSDSLAREFKYADRYAYVVRDMEHAHLLSNLLPYPQLRAEQRLGYAFVWKTVRSFLDAYVKGDSSGRAFMSRSAVQNGFPSWLVKTELKLTALPAVPTAEEVEQIAMTPDVERLRTIFRTARASDSTVRLFTTDNLNLYAFRFAQRGNHAVAISFNELAVEAFPRSTTAANNLGNSYRTAGQMPRAIEWWRKALMLIDADPELAADDKTASRSNIEAKIGGAQPSGYFDDWWANGSSR